MQDFKKDMKQNYFLEFQIVQGAIFWDFQLALSKFNPWLASGKLLISNSADINLGFRENRHAPTLPVPTSKPLYDGHKLH